MPHLSQKGKRVPCGHVSARLEILTVVNGESERDEPKRLFHAVCNLIGAKRIHCFGHSTEAVGKKPLMADFVRKSLWAH